VDRRRETYTAFYWVAAVSVVSLILTALLLLVSTLTPSRLVLAISFGVGAAAFFEALLCALWLVGEIVRLGLYGPRFERYKDYLPAEEDDDQPQAE
jgi:hypothetical protein